jgi:endonuclease-3
MPAPKPDNLPRRPARRLPPNARARAAAIFPRLAAANPDPRTELEYHNPYTLLVAVVLSAQTTDVAVNKATARLFEQVRHPAQMLELTLDELKSHIRTIGLYNAKAVNVLELSRLLIERHGGEVPADRDALQALPGVGRKTASVVLNEAFGHIACAVDTHVFRVAHRLGLTTAPTPDAVEDDLLRIIPTLHARAAHHLLILHGRYVCTARAPKCSQCPLLELCPWPGKPLASPAVNLAERTLLPANVSELNTEPPPQES